MIRNFIWRLRFMLYYRRYSSPPWRECWTEASEARKRNPNYSDPKAAAQIQVRHTENKDGLQSQDKSPGRSTKPRKRHGGVRKRRNH